MRQEELAYADIGVQVKHAEERLSELNHEIEVAKVKRQTAEELALKDLELEGEKRRAEFEAQLAAEFEEKQRNSPADKYQQILDGLNA